MLKSKNGNLGPRSGGPLPPNRPSGGEVLSLHFDEVLEFDADRLVELVVRHGEEGTQKLVDTALREIATLTAELVHDMHIIGKARAHKTKSLCDQIDKLGCEIGLPVFRSVVLDIRACHGRSDANALAAVLHRLVRLAARAMRQSWDISEHWP